MLNGVEVEAWEDKGAKRRKKEETSTPRWEYREREGQILGMSPIGSSPIFDLNGTIDSLGSSFSDQSSGTTATHSVGLSPKLRKLLIQPRNRSEEEENLMLLRETLNLTRAALWRGIIQDEELEINVFSKPVGDDLVLSELLHGMNLRTWDYDVSSNPSILKTRKRGGVLWREEECLFKNDCLFKKDELNFIFGKKQDREIITGLEPDLGESPVLRKRDRKRSLSPDENTQIGTLNKQNTMIKNSESVRRKLNQMYFIGGASGEVSLTAGKTPVTCHSTQRRGGKKKAV